MKITNFTNAQRNAICAFGLPDRQQTIGRLKVVSRLAQKKDAAKELAELASFIRKSNLSDSEWRTLYYRMKHRKKIARIQATLEWHEKYGYPEEARPWRFIAKTQVLEVFGDWSLRRTCENLVWLRSLVTDPIVLDIIQDLMDDCKAQNWEGETSYECFYEACIDTIPFMKESDDALHQRYWDNLAAKKGGNDIERGIARLYQYANEAQKILAV